MGNPNKNLMSGCWSKEYQGKMTGLKFFNVFGPNEYHKGDMKSVVSKAYDRVASEGKMSLFKSYNPKYKDGEQMRDFIYVKDAVDVVMFFMEHPSINGIFNLGTGRARTWNDLAHALFAAVGTHSLILNIWKCRKFCGAVINILPRRTWPNYAKPGIQKLLLLWKMRSKIIAVIYQPSVAGKGKGLPMVLFIILGAVVLIAFVVLGVLFYMLSKEGQKKEEEKAVPVTDLEQLKKEITHQAF